MTIKLSDIDALAQKKRELDTAISKQDALKHYLVIGVLIGRNTTVSDPIALRATTGGTGYINSIGFPPDLRSRLQQALDDWLEDKVIDARNALAELNVDVAA